MGEADRRRAPADHGRGQPAHARHRAGDPARRRRSPETCRRSPARGRCQGAGRRGGHQGQAESRTSGGARGCRSADAGAPQDRALGHAARRHLRARRQGRACRQRRGRPAEPARYRAHDDEARPGRDSVRGRQGRAPLHADRRRQEEGRGDRRQRDEAGRAVGHGPHRGTGSSYRRPIRRDRDCVSASLVRSATRCWPCAARARATRAWAWPSSAWRSSASFRSRRV